LALIAALLPAAAAAQEKSLIDQFGRALDMARQGRSSAEAASVEENHSRNAYSQLDDQTASVAEKTLNSVVTVVTVTQIDRKQQFSLLALALGRKIEIGPAVKVERGTGWVARADGVLVTNAHVVSQKEIGDKVIIQFRDHLNLSAIVVAKNTAKDLALLKIESKRNDWPVLPFGNSANLRPGQRMIALGSALGLRETVTVGSFSRSSVNLELYPGRYLQTDAAINHGNSGGPLIDVDGRVIGVNFSISGNSNGGIGWAIPVEYVRQALAQYSQGKPLTNATLGVSFEETSAIPQSYLAKLRGWSPEKAPSMHDEGAWIAAVAPGSPAAKIGLQKGDRIVAVGGVSLPPAGGRAAGRGVLGNTTKN
jgi:S1-C subfamily serine protease